MRLWTPRALDDRPRGALPEARAPGDRPSPALAGLSRRDFGSPLQRALPGVALALLAASGVGAALAQAPLSAPTSPAGAAAVVEQLRTLPLPRMQVTGRHESSPGERRPLPALEIRRQRIYDELHVLGSRAVPALARALRDPDVGMRRNVAVALDVLAGGWWSFASGVSRLDLRPALPALIAALSDPDATVRAWTAQDIGDMGREGRPALPALRDRLWDRSPAVRALARQAIEKVSR
jgi:hypothetical protein